MLSHLFRIFCNERNIAKIEYKYFEKVKISFTHSLVFIWFFQVSRLNEGENVLQFSNNFNYEYHT